MLPPTASIPTTDDYIEACDPPELIAAEKQLDVLVKEKKAAELIHKSVSWLQKDRCKPDGSNVVPFRQIGRSIFYSIADLKTVRGDS